MAFGPKIYKTALKIQAFDGGLNTKFQNTNTPLHQSPDLQNVKFDDYGAVGTVNGYNIFNTAAIASAPIDGMSKYIDSSGDDQLLVACDGTIWYASGTSFVSIPSSTDQYTSTVDVGMIRVDDWTYISNGSVRAHKYDGTNFLTVGVDPVSGAASAASSGSGVMSGTYRWALTGVNTSNVESDYTIIVSGLSVTGGRVQLTDIPVFPTSAGVDIKYLYRTTGTAGGDSVLFYRVTALTAGVVNYEDDHSDSSLSSTQAPTDNGVMPEVKYMVYYRGRVFAAGNSTYEHRLYFSNSGAPEVWPSTNYIDIEPGDGHPITGIEAFGNAIVVHKNDGQGRGSIYLVYIGDSTGYTDADNWYVFKSPSAYSGISHKAQAFFENLLFFLNRNGVYGFTGEDLARSAADAQHGRFISNTLSYNIEPDIKDIDLSTIHKSAAIRFDNKVYLAVPSGSGSGVNNRIYVYDFERISESGDQQIGAWSYRTSPNINCWIEHDNELYGGSSDDDGYVYKLSSTNYNYGGSAIDSYYWTARIFGHEEHREYTKVFRFLYIRHTCPGDWNLTVEYRNEESDDTTSTTVSLDSGGSEWDNMEWDNDVWNGGTGSKTSRVILENATGKWIQFKFSTNSADEYWKIHEIEVLYSLRSRR